MRAREISSNLCLASAVFSGCGTAQFGNAARLAAMLLEEGAAREAEQRGIIFSAQAGVNNFILSTKSLASADVAGFFAHLFAQSPAPDASQLQRFAAELTSEESDYDLQAFRGFAKRLMGLPHDKSTPSAQQCEQFFAALKTAPLNFCLSAKNPGEFAALNALERPGFADCAKTFAAAPFDESAACAANQSFIYFGAPLREFSLKERAAAAVISTAIGAGFTSRITELIRVQNGLAYSAYAQIRFDGEFAYWLGFLQTKLSTAARAKELLRGEFARLKEGLSAAEFAASQQYLLNSAVLKNKDDFARQKVALNDLCAQQCEGFSELLSEQIAQVDLKFINDLLSEFCQPLCFYSLDGTEDGEGGDEGADGDGGR